MAVRICQTSALFRRSIPSARQNATFMFTRTLATNQSDGLPKFPQAMGSPRTTRMDFTSPNQVPCIPTFHVMNARGEMADKAREPPDVSDEQVLTWYKNMVTVNIMDSVMFEAQRQGRVSFYMVSAGEEGVTVGSAAALDPEDVITCQYREHGVFLQRGFELKDFMAQLTANHNDPGKGRNMPNHYSGKSKVNVHAVASTLATQIPHATGAAYALKMIAKEDPSNPPRVAAAYFGEGATSEGDFHAAVNVAAVRKCPVLFLCRNNGFAISTPTTEQYAGDGIAIRGIGYGVESIRVDGTDIFAVYEATKEARRRALEGGGRPIIIEFMSYRVSHHSTSDDSSAYRDSKDLETWKTRDSPITRLRTWLENRGLWNEQMDNDLKKSVRKDVLRELVAAEKEQKPPLSAIFDDVYAELTQEAKEQREELRRLLQKYPAEYDVHEHRNGLGGL
ncbi:thiamine diphosphate-binding protein [Aspergillus pseudodeflectus]|uniref:2-oxoisovalerate dehydrogenase subunit alpha n=1 Tax=Aspergillus pseudodeflectus TaxID=176178 RepID=A0ABR4K1R4_9EURO